MKPVHATTILTPTGTVLDSDGRLLGRVEVPAGFRIHEIGEDYLLGVWYDEYEVPVVRRYSLVKTG